MSRGRIAFWRYRHPSQGYRGYHLAADVAACEQLLRELAQAGPKGIDLDLTPLTDAILAVPNSRADAVDFKSLRIEIAKNAEPTVRVEEKHSRCTVVLSGDGDHEFTAGIKGLANGDGGDCGIGPEGHEIRFWWWPKRL
jgi:hypothetical protein